MTAPTAPEDRLLAAVDRLDRRLAGEASVSGRVARLEDETIRLRETVVTRVDVATLSARIEGLSSRIDLLAEQVAATAPRLRTVESSVETLRGSTARQSELEIMERSLGELSTRVDAYDQRHSARAARLSSQVTGWLISLLLLVLGAMVSYALMGGR